MENTTLHEQLVRLAELMRNNGFKVGDVLFTYDEIRSSPSLQGREISVESWIGDYLSEYLDLPAVERLLQKHAKQTRLSEKEALSLIREDAPGMDPSLRIRTKSNARGIQRAWKELLPELASEDPNRFVFDGNMWLIRWQGTDLDAIDHVKGMRYLWYLLRHPNLDMLGADIKGEGLVVETVASGACDDKKAVMDYIEQLNQLLPKRDWSGATKRKFRASAIGEIKEYLAKGPALEYRESFEQALKILLEMNRRPPQSDFAKAAKQVRESICYAIDKKIRKKSKDLAAHMGRSLKYQKGHARLETQEVWVTD